jgi:hypothetical protein
VHVWCSCDHANVHPAHTLSCVVRCCCVCAAAVCLLSNRRRVLCLHFVALIMPSCIPPHRLCCFAQGIVFTAAVCAVCLLSNRRRVLLKKLSLMMRRGPRMSQQVRGWCRTSGHSAPGHAVCCSVCWHNRRFSDSHHLQLRHSSDYGWGRTHVHTAPVHAVLVCVLSNGLTLYEKQ